MTSCLTRNKTLFEYIYKQNIILIHILIHLLILYINLYKNKKLDEYLSFLLNSNENINIY